MLRGTSPAHAAAPQKTVRINYQSRAKGCPVHEPDAILEVHLPWFPSLVSLKSPDTPRSSRLCANRDLPQREALTVPNTMSPSFSLQVVCFGHLSQQDGINPIARNRC